MKGLKEELRQRKSKITIFEGKLKSTLNLDKKATRKIDEVKETTKGVGKTDK